MGCEYRNKLYRVNVGNSDDGEQIKAMIQTGRNNLGTTMMKGIPQAYIGMSGDGEMLLYTITNSRNGAMRRDWYRVNAKINDGESQKPVPLKRGVTSVYWQFELENVDGGDFNVDTMQFKPVVLRRRK